MQAADAGAGGGVEGADDGADGPGSPGGAGEATAAALGRAPPVTRPRHAPRPGGDAAATAGRTGGPTYVFALCVPFPSAVEAEIACGSLKQLTVRGSVLAVRWRATNPRLLRISIISFLDQLSLVMRTMQRFGPPATR
uniref:L antigen family member 3 n=1 Tax=Canis lupus familiaris TaxID=9615 RepID=A0A8C0S3Y5_CANLF